MTLTRRRPTPNSESRELERKCHATENAAVRNIMWVKGNPQKRAVMPAKFQPPPSPSEPREPRRTGGETPVFHVAWFPFHSPFPVFFTLQLCAMHSAPFLSSQTSCRIFWPKTIRLQQQAKFTGFGFPRFQRKDKPKEGSSAAASSVIKICPILVYCLALPSNLFHCRCRKITSRKTLDE